MSRKKALAVYLLGTFSQLLLVCLVVFLSLWRSFCSRKCFRSNDWWNLYSLMG